VRWHVQRLGPKGAPQILLIHGTGSSSHSWRHLTALLCPTFEVLQFDLPGHGFTHAPVSQDVSLPGIADAVADLLTQLQARPSLVIGHSAGAAVAAQLVLGRRVAPLAWVALNGALLPLHGLAGHVFSPVARALASQGLVPRLFAWNASRPAVVERLIAGTGSQLDAEGLRLYGRLVGDASHAAGALRMMAAWDLRALALRLPQLITPLHLVAGTRDRTLPHNHSERVQQAVPAARLTLMEGLGHLAHEEDAPRVLAALAPELALLRP